MESRTYDPERDFEAFFRLTVEAGWAKDVPREREAHALLARCGRALVAEAGGAVESYATAHGGTMRYVDTELPLSVVTGVATGRVARRHGLGLRLTADLVRAVARDGAAVALLGIFDQGYYDKLGFGTGPYDVAAAIDPADIEVEAPPRVPLRLDASDWERIHAARVGRRRGHGSIVLESADVTRFELMRRENSIQLGFEDPATGEITHALCAFPQEAEGPWWIAWWAYRTPDQFRDLLALVKSFGDQVRLVRFVEPPGIQIQSVVRRPVRRREIGVGGKYDATSKVLAWWQARILDLPRCVAAARLPGSDSVTFRLELTDPLPDLAGGDWTVTFGPESRAERASGTSDLPVLRTSVNTFSRLWLGAARPTDLAYLAPDLHAPPDLLDALDRLLRLPRPCTDWDV